MTITASFELDNNASGASGEFMDSRSIAIDTNGMGTITFAGHGGSGAMGAVDDVMPTAYGESFDILGTANDQTGATTGTIIFNAIGSASSNNMITYSSGDLVDGLAINASYTPSGTGEVESSVDFALSTLVMKVTLGYAVGENNASGGTSNLDLTTFYVKYAYGPVTVGYQESKSKMQLMQLMMMSSKLWVLHTKLATT